MAFATVLVPILTIYTQFLNSGLMAHAAVTNNVMGKLDGFYSARADEFYFSQLGMRNLCAECYCFLNGLSLRKLKYLLAGYRKDPNKRSMSRQPGSGRLTSNETVDCELWFKELIDTMGEPSPENTNVYLPPATKADFFRQYCDDRPSPGYTRASRSAFFRIWRTKFSHLKVVTAPRLGKCIHCIKYRALLDAEKDPKVA